MENLESLTQKLEDIELLFASNIEAMNKIVKESNDPEKRQKEAQILNEASKRHESLLNEISGLISKEKAAYWPSGSVAVMYCKVVS